MKKALTTRPGYRSAHIGIVCCMLLCCFILSCFRSVSFAQDRQEQFHTTVMIYLCGSNLETEGGAATADIAEMLSSGLNTEQVQLVVMAGGSKSSLTFSPEKANLLEFRRRTPDSPLTFLTKEVSDRNMGEAQTLQYFLDYSVEQYPADNYALILWDHGGGPLDGICQDEVYAPDRLSMSEVADALAGSLLPGKLKWIGFDACLMSSFEVAAQVAPYADYMIASEETEPAGGWNYSFLKGIEEDADGAAAGARIIDTYFEGMQDVWDTLTLSCIDLSKTGQVMDRMDTFFASVQENLDESSYTDLADMVLETTSFGKAVRRVSDQGYDLLDLRSLVDHYDRPGEAKDLLEALDEAVVYSRSNREDVYGISVYHPYRNKDRYEREWEQEYEDLVLTSQEYKEYVKRFGSFLLGRTFADWSGLQTLAGAAGQDGSLSFYLPLTKEQQDNVASVQMVVLAASDKYGDQLAGTGMDAGAQTRYIPIYSDQAGLEEDGAVHAQYRQRALYITDENGNPIAGPMSYHLSEDGQSYYFMGEYRDYSGREVYAPSRQVMFSCVQDSDHNLRVVSREVFDEVTGTYTNRLQLNEASYTDLFFEREALEYPEWEEVPQGVDTWDKASDYVEVQLPLKWGVSFFDEAMTGAPLYVTFQVTDLQQNTYSCPLLRVVNPNTQAVTFEPEFFEQDDFRLHLYAIKDSSALDPGLNIGVEITNLTEERHVFRISDFVLNGTRTVNSGWFDGLFMYLKVEPGESAFYIQHISYYDLIGLSSLESLSFNLSEDLYSSSEKLFPVSMQISQTSLSFTEWDLTKILSEDDADSGSVWQLLSFEKNARGGYGGILRIRNETDELIAEDGIVSLEGLQTDGGFYVYAVPHTDAVVTFRSDNRSMLREYSARVSGRTDNKALLATDHLLERFGIQQISRITLLTEKGFAIKDHIDFSLEHPVEVAGGEAELTTSETAPRMLLEGEVSAELDRILVADNGIGIRLILRNDGDEDRYLMLTNRYLDWKPEETGLFGRYLLPAHSICIACSMFNCETDPDQPEPVQELEMTFRMMEQTSPFAAIRFQEPVQAGTDGGIFLSPQDVDTLAVRFRESSPVTVHIDGDMELDLQAHLYPVNGVNCTGMGTGLTSSAPYTPDPVLGDEHTQKNAFMIELTVENLSLDTPIQFSSSKMSAREDLETKVSFRTDTLKPGRRQVLQEFFSLEDLAPLERLDQLMFTLKQTARYDTPITFTFAETDFSEQIRKAAEQGEHWYMPAGEWDNGTVRISLAFTDWQEAFEVGSEELAGAMMALEFTNLSDKPVHFETDPIVLNDALVIHEWRSYDYNRASFYKDFEPGQSEIMYLTIDKEVLEELGSVHSCSFLMTEEPADTHRREAQVTLHIEDGEFQNYVYDNQPLASAQVEDHIWKLMNLERREDGLIIMVLQADDENLWDTYRSVQIMMNGTPTDMNADTPFLLWQRSYSEKSACRIFRIKEAPGIGQDGMVNQVEALLEPYDESREAVSVLF